MRKMYRLFMIILQMIAVKSVPLPMNFLAPHEMLQRPQIQSPLPLLQEQMMELQAMQQLQSMPQMPMAMDLMQPLIILLPNTQNSPNTNNNEKTTNKKITDKRKEENFIDEDLDSVVIEAEPMEPIPVVEDTHKAILLVPNARFSIGGIISSIPWLPIEINVPDTIAWMYNGIANGISGIISIIGNRFPQNSQSRLKFRPFNNFRNNFARPIMVVPM